MPPRRTPALIALELLDCVEVKKEATKWDLIKVLGNEAQFRVWVERFFLVDKILEERRDGRNYFYNRYYFSIFAICSTLPLNLSPPWSF